MTEHQLRIRLEALGAGPATADWGDAHSRAARQSRRRTKLALAVAATALLLVIPAIAVATGEIDFWTAEPANPRVVVAFESMDRHRPLASRRSRFATRERSSLARSPPGCSPRGRGRSPSRSAGTAISARSYQGRWAAALSAPAEVGAASWR